MKYYPSLRRSSLVILYGIAGVLALHSDVVGDYAVGRKGEALKQTLRQHCAPISYVDSKMPMDGYVAIVADLQKSVDDATVTDAVTGRKYNAANIVNTLSLSHVIHESWFGMPVVYGSRAKEDLFNCILTSPDVMKTLSSGAGFASVVSATDIISGEGWSKGTVDIDGWNIPVVEPDDAVKGLVARRIFYLATIYPCSIWTADGAKFFTNAEYPGLSGFSTDTYLTWHRTYPVSEFERQSNAAAERRQGNRNPYVDYPELAEYLWGVHSGEVYPGIGGSVADDNDPPGEDEEDPKVRIPLRGSYAIADEYLDLYSPYVPEGVVWSVDGVEMEETRIPLADLGVGKHELKYSGRSCAGKLIIEIMP